MEVMAAMVDTEVMADMEVMAVTEDTEDTVDTGMEDTMEAAMVTAMEGEAMVEATVITAEAMVMAAGGMVDIMEDTEMKSVRIC